MVENKCLLFKSDFDRRGKDNNISISEEESESISNKITDIQAINYGKRYLGLMA